MRLDRDAAHFKSIPLSTQRRSNGPESASTSPEKIRTATASAARTSERMFLVEGDGPFPIDMLRHEQCWPAKRQDAVAIATEPRSGASYRQVVLATHNNRAPLFCRWRSKGWLVIV